MSKGPTIRFLVVLLLFVTAAQSQSPASTNDARAKEAEDIREVVFRHLLRGHEGTDEVYLYVEGKDPSKQLLDRFKGHRPPVKPASEGDLYVPIIRKDPKTGEISRAEAVKPDDDLQRSRKTGKLATSFSVGKILWHSEVSAEVKARHYRGPLWGGGYTATLRKRNGRWGVEKIEMVWIS